MSESPEQNEASEDSGGSVTSLAISAAFVVAWLILFALDRAAPGGIWALPQTLAQVAVISIVIWQVCDPFADAAQWVGARFRLPESMAAETAM